MGCRGYHLTHIIDTVADTLRVASEWSEIKLHAGDSKHGSMHDVALRLGQLIVMIRRDASLTVSSLDICERKDGTKTRGVSFLSLLSPYTIALLDCKRQVPLIRRVRL
jgi:hypothetical protein